MDIKNLENLFENLQDFHHRLYEFFLSLTEEIKEGQLSNEELCDIGFLLRELKNLADETRKEAKVREELCGRMIAFKVIKAVLADPTAELNVKGELATGIPDVKQQAELPKFGTPEYYSFTDHFKIPRALAEEGILKLSWIGVTDYCTKLAQQGEEVPPGLGRVIPLYFTSFRRRKSHGKKEEE